MNIRVDTTAISNHAKTLNSIGKSAMPNAIRGSLNSLAFDVKQKTMPMTSQAKFTNRQPNFFKANSRVEQAVGKDVSVMSSKVGFVSTSLKGGNNHAVKDLQQQEKGGRIKKKSFIPMRPSRKGGSPGQVVQAKNRLSSINNIVSADSQPGNHNRQKFVSAVFRAGVGGTILTNFKGKELLWRVNSLRLQPNGDFKITPIYSFKRNRSVSVGRTNFMKQATDLSSVKIYSIFYKEISRQLDRKK
jgi:hypothetical protein